MFENSFLKSARPALREIYDVYLPESNVQTCSRNQYKISIKQQRLSDFISYKLSKTAVSLASPSTTCWLTSIRCVISSISLARLLALPATPPIPLALSSTAFVIMPTESAMPEMELFRCCVRS